LDRARRAFRRTLACRPQLGHEHVPRALLQPCQEPLLLQGHVTLNQRQREGDEDGDDAGPERHVQAGQRTPEQRQHPRRPVGAPPRLTNPTIRRPASTTTAATPTTEPPAMYATRDSPATTRAETPTRPPMIQRARVIATPPPPRGARRRDRGRGDRAGGARETA